MPLQQLINGNIHPHFDPGTDLHAKRFKERNLTQVVLELELIRSHTGGIKTAGIAILFVQDRSMPQQGQGPSTCQ